MSDNQSPHVEESPEAGLVKRVIEQSRAPLSIATRERLAQALLDWFTAGRSALRTAAAARLRGLAGDLYPCGGDASVFGGTSATPMAAAFANAGIAHLREIDDAHRAAMLHPGVVAVSPVLALATWCRLTQAQLARAVVAGYEVSLRVGEALGAGHAGTFHATATAGSVGAAAATAMALGLDADRLHHALGIGATQAAGLWQIVDDDAHEAKSLHPGFAVRNGMTAGFAARAGLPGARRFVTGRRGLYAALGGDGPIEALTGSPDEPERLHTATIKAWPACAMLFTPLDAVQSLIDRDGLDAADIERLEIELFPHALKIAGVHWPTRPAEAAFSLRYVVAVLLVHGRVGIEHVDSPELGSPVLLALADRIVVRPVDAFQAAFPERRPSRVIAVLRDGRRLEAYRDLRRGDPEDPFTWTSLQARLRAFAPDLDDAGAHAIVGWCERIVDPSRDETPASPPAALFAASP